MLTPNGGVFGRNPKFNNLTLSGAMSSAGSITLGTGANLVVASGNGISFAATAGTGTSELFDDYEEGTWTPVLEGSSTAGTGTYAVQHGKYTKIGNVVRVECSLYWTAHTGTGNMNITGLPFTRITVANTRNPLAIIPVLTDLPADSVLACNVLSNSAFVALLSASTAGGSTSVAALAMDTNCAVYLAGTYETAA